VINATAAVHDRRACLAWTGARERWTTLAASLVALLAWSSRSAPHCPPATVRNFLALLMTILISTMMVVIRRHRDVSMLPAGAVAFLARSSSGRGGARQRTGWNFFYLALFGTTHSGWPASAHDRHAPDLGHAIRPGRRARNAIGAGPGLARLRRSAALATCLAAPSCSPPSLAIF